MRPRRRAKRKSVAYAGKHQRVSTPKRSACVRVKIESVAMSAVPSPAEQIAMCKPLAVMISGQDPAPDWLAFHLKQWIPCLLLGRVVLAQQPTRAQVIKQMRGLLAAISTVSAAIVDDAAKGLLELPPAVPLEDAACMRMLTDLAARATGVVEHPDFVTVDGKVRPGRSRALPKSLPSARDDCAGFVADAWEACRGKAPSPRSVRAAEAAQAFWELVGGASTGWGNTRAPGWRHPFENAVWFKMSAYRVEQRRHLTEAIHDADRACKEE